MKIVSISDTHMSHDEITVPPGDILIHAGDATGMGTLKEVLGFRSWFAAQPHKHKIFVAGNHDFLFQDTPELGRELMANAGIIYLEDSSVTIEGLTVYGSPWQPEFGGWAFNLPRGYKLRAKWAMIPEKVDVLVTHGPPHGILDMTPDGRRVGCADLLYRLGTLSPRLHVFGHIHRSYGQLTQAGTHFVNASICNENNWAENRPVVVEL